MKELNKKVFLILFGMLTVILIVSLVIVNVIGYRREYESISRNLRVMDDRGMFGGAAPPDSEGDMNFQNGNQEPKKGDFSEETTEEASKESEEAPDIENMMFMDHEVYTVELAGGAVNRIISHGNENSDFDAEAAANEILSEYSNDTIRIENLYRDGYSFNYRRDKIVIINQSNTAAKLRKLLIETIVIFIVLEAIIVLISKLVTGWITKPAREAFDKQREFIADASHELKTPLAVIMASSDEITDLAPAEVTAGNRESENFSDGFRLLATLLEDSLLDGVLPLFLGNLVLAPVRPGIIDHPDIIILGSLVRRQLRRLRGVFLPIGAHGLLPLDMTNIALDPADQILVRQPDVLVGVQPALHPVREDVRHLLVADGLVGRIGRQLLVHGHGTGADLLLEGVRLQATVQPVHNVHRHDVVIELHQRLLLRDVRNHSPFFKQGLDKPLVHSYCPNSLVMSSCPARLPSGIAAACTASEMVLPRYDDLPLP